MHADVLLQTADVLDARLDVLHDGLDTHAVTAAGDLAEDTEVTDVHILDMRDTPTPAPVIGYLPTEEAATETDVRPEFGRARVARTVITLTGGRGLGRGTGSTLEYIVDIALWGDRSATRHVGIPVHKDKDVGGRHGGRHGGVGG